MVTRRNSTLSQQGQRALVQVLDSARALHILACSSAPVIAVHSECVVVCHKCLVALCASESVSAPATVGFFTPVYLFTAWVFLLTGTHQAWIIV